MAFDPASAGRLVIYGGTFDPPHRAHVELPRAAAAAIDADGVLYVPAGRPPHKLAHQQTDARHRLAMLERALAGLDNVAISTFEIDQPGPSYTVATLEHLRKSLGDRVEFRLLIGVDMALVFAKWHQPDRIEQLAQPLVMARPPHDRQRFVDALPADQRDRWRGRIVDLPLLAISSTELRRAIADHGVEAPLAREALAPAVRRYIAEHGLYTGAIE